MSEAPASDRVVDDLDRIGEHLREERTKKGLSQRELARRLGLSASLISQLESGMSKPSVGTLYAIVTELGVSLDQVIRREGLAEEQTSGDTDLGAEETPLLHPGEREAIDLASGVRWEELTAETEPGIDFLHATYQVGGASTPDESLMRHQGREYGYVISGTLSIQIAFNDYELGPGDSIGFESTRPHRLYNRGDEPVHAIWLVVGDENPHS